MWMSAAAAELDPGVAALQQQHILSVDSAQYSTLSLQVFITRYVMSPNQGNTCQQEVIRNWSRLQQSARRLQKMAKGMQDSDTEVNGSLCPVHFNHLTTLFVVRSNRTIARFRAANNMLGSSVRPILPTGSCTLATVCLLYKKCRSQAWCMVSHVYIKSWSAYEWCTHQT